MEIRFYHVQKTPLVLATCSLVRKAWDRRLQAIVVGSDPYLMQDLDKTLWSFDPESFIPHLLFEDDPKPDDSPAVKLISNADHLAAVLKQGGGNPCAVFTLNASELPLSQENEEAGREGQSPEEKPENWPTMICEVFDGNNSVVVEEARRKWTAYKQLAQNSPSLAPITLTYWQENPHGGWQQKQAG